MTTSRIRLLGSGLGIPAVVGCLTLLGACGSTAQAPVTLGGIGGDTALGTGGSSAVNQGGTNSPDSSSSSTLTGSGGATTNVGTGGTVATGGTASTTTSAGSGGLTNTGGSSVANGGGSYDNGAPAGSPVASHGQLQVVGTQLQDQGGNPIQLKGVSSMWLNWETKPFAESKNALQYMRDNWKLSLIRASMGIEASGGYLDTKATTTGITNKANMQAKVEKIVQNAIDLGVYVLVDWHTEKAVTQQADSVAFFTAMATKYGNYPNVIFEPYNEPNGTGTTWALIKPYHEAVVAAIRGTGSQNLIVMGTPKFSQDVDLASQDPVAGTNLLYTLHFYACTHAQKLRDKANIAIANGLALFVTEFGATPSDGGVIPTATKTGSGAIICEPETNNWFAWMAENNISGAAWKLEQCTDSSCILAASAPVDGPWTDNYLSNDASGTPVTGGVQGGGHGLFVVNWIRQ